MEHETTYLQTSKWHVKNIFVHLGFKHHTDQTVCVILEKPSNPSIFDSCPGCPKETVGAYR